MVRNRRSPPVQGRKRGRPRPAASQRRLIAFNKPFDVLCQFSADGSARATLGDFLPGPDLYPAGRLDKDSEGLLLLTNDGRLQAHIADPRHKLEKRYWVQVDGKPEADQIEALRRGVVLNDGPTRPADVRLLDAPELWPRDPPVRYRKTVPTGWLAIGIREGRNRQLRRMTAAVGLPTLRLLRVQIGPWRLDDLACGAWQSLPLPAGFRD
ncbi:MAG: pseudouridine synthase [Salinisphaeraceae bacterium]|nr:pseudouridine synthase [Salinisphaeraceae bacterium]